MSKKDVSCPECDHPPDGYPLLVDKSTHYWCYSCKRSYDRETLEELKAFGIPYSQVLENIRKYGKSAPSEEDKEKDSGTKNAHHQVFKNLKKYGKPFPPKGKDTTTKMRNLEEKYICGYCRDTGYVVGVNGKFKTDMRTGLERIRCPRGCRTTK